MKRTDPTRPLLDPSKPLESPTFAYTHSTRTDIRQLFERIRAQQQGSAQNVAPIKRRKTP